MEKQIKRPRDIFTNLDIDIAASLNSTLSTKERRQEFCNYAYTELKKIGWEPVRRGFYQTFINKLKSFKGVIMCKLLLR